MVGFFNLVVEEKKTSPAKTLRSLEPTQNQKLGLAVGAGSP